MFAATMLLPALTGAVAQTEPGPAANSLPTPSRLVQRLAAGGRYVIVTRRDLFPRPSHGNMWFSITGYYVPSDGTWTSGADGFPSPGTPWHSCPSNAICGGIHEAGMPLERRYEPEQHEMVAIGQRLTFDDDGRLFHQGRHIGYVIAPDIPDN
jgi:hypothetical protein